jgi:hypothetical protein
MLSLAFSCSPFFSSGVDIGEAIGAVFSAWSNAGGMGASAAGIAPCPCFSMSIISCGFTAIYISYGYITLDTF